MKLVNIFHITKRIRSRQICSDFRIVKKEDALLNEAGKKTK
jgi:hypothetical protein